MTPASAGTSAGWCRLRVHRWPDPRRRPGAAAGGGGHDHRAILNSGGSLQMESRAILEMCARPRSLAEVGAALGVPVGVARVLVGDLANGGYLEVHLPEPLTATAAPVMKSWEGCSMDSVDVDSRRRPPPSAVG